MTDDRNDAPTAPDARAAPENQPQPTGRFFDMVRNGEGHGSGTPLTAESTALAGDDATLAEPASEGAAPDEAEDGAEMPHEARRVLVYLMRQGAILAAQKGKLYDALCRYEALIRRHLAEVYLRLVLDQKAGLAFVARFDQDDAAPELAEEEAVSLITRRTLSLYDTLLLLVLRRHYQERESAGEQKIAVDVERLESYLTPFLPLTQHATADRKKLNAAIQKLVQRKVMAAMRGSDDRYEITPIIRYVVDAVFLDTMLVDYLRLAGEANVALEPQLTEATPKAADHRHSDLFGDGLL